MRHLLNILALSLVLALTSCTVLSNYIDHKIEQKISNSPVINGLGKNIEKINNSPHSQLIWLTIFTTIALALAAWKVKVLVVPVIIFYIGLGAWLLIKPELLILTISLAGATIAYLVGLTVYTAYKKRMALKALQSVTKAVEYVNDPTVKAVVDNISTEDKTKAVIDQVLDKQGFLTKCK